MNYYSIGLNDEQRSSWTIYRVLKRLPDRPKTIELPGVFYRFFPRENVQIQIKPEYQHLCCTKCGRYDSDRVFEVGFDDPVMIRTKGDYVHTKDRVFAVSDRFLAVLKHGKVGGYESKTLGKTGWHALRVTFRVDHSGKVIKSRKPLCSECGRPKESYGLFEYLRDVSLPSGANTFFTTKEGWPASHGMDREIFVTEDVAHALKRGIRGGFCNRLLTDDEMKERRKQEKNGVPLWTPRGWLVKFDGRIKRPFFFPKRHSRLCLN